MSKIREEGKCVTRSKEALLPGDVAKSYGNVSTDNSGV